MTTLDYRYIECGLDNVILEGFPVGIDDAGEDIITVPNINVLHQVILHSVASKPSGLQGKELRFVRSELGLTQAQLAEIVRKDAQTVGRWERGDTSIDETSELIVRIRALQHLGEELPLVEELSKLTIRSSVEPPIMIDARTPGEYKLAA